MFSVVHQPKKSETKLDTPFFIQKSYSGTIYIECFFEEDSDIKTQIEFITSPIPVISTEAVSKVFVDIGMYDPSIVRNPSHVDFIDKNLDKVQFVLINSLPAVREHP